MGKKKKKEKKKKKRKGKSRRSARPAGKIVVRFVDSFEAPYDDTVRSVLAAWPGFQRAFPGATIGPLYFSLSPERLTEIYKQASESVEGLTHLLRFYAIRLSGPSSLEAALAMVQTWIEVDHAYIAYDPLPVQGAPPDLSGEQHYQKRARRGIDAHFAWQIQGGHGEGIAFADIEWAWGLQYVDENGVTQDHPDLYNNIPIDGENQNDINRRAHGTQVLGVVCALDNQAWYKGTAPGVADIRLVSVRRITIGGVIVDFDDAVLTAINLLDPVNNGGLQRGVLLIEAQTWARDANTGILQKMPLEVQPAVRNAFQVAFGKELTVVEAAGNGNHNLDDYTELDTGLQPFTVLDPYNDPNNLHSRAILVAAANPADPDDYVHWFKDYEEGTNYGARIDCFGWGERVATLEPYPPFYDPNKSFNGTSAASAIVAGAALSVQGIAKQHMMQPLPPQALRHLLSTYGTRPKIGSNDLLDQLGRMPDLRLIASEYFGLTPDVFARDNPADVGAPHTGALASSPDIIVRNAQVADPQAQWGEGSGTEQNEYLSHDLKEGETSWIYVRVRNRGDRPAENVLAHVYWSEVSTLLLPSMWNLIGTAHIPEVPAVPPPGTPPLTVSPQGVAWPSVPAPGHYCFVAVLHAPGDPPPTLQALSDFDVFKQFIRDENNVTWRNFNVVGYAAPAGAEMARAAAMEFQVPGPPDRDRWMKLEVHSTLPRGSELVAEVLDDWLWGMAPIPSQRPGLQVVLDPSGVTLFKGNFPARMRTRVRLTASVPARSRDEYRIWIRQLENDEEIGRLTWVLRPRRP